MNIAFRRLPAFASAVAIFLTILALTQLRIYEHMNVNARSVQLRNLEADSIDTITSARISTESQTSLYERTDSILSETLLSHQVKPNEVDIMMVSNNETGQLQFNCVPAHIMDLTLPICIYERTRDRHVSRSFSQGKYWEAANVMGIMNYIHSIVGGQYSTLSFLDLGANLGGYSLPIAKLGCSVLAVEPNLNTLTRLATSVRMNEVNNNMKIYKNAVSDTRGKLHMEQDTTNRGNTFISDGARGNRRVWWRRMIDYLLGREFRRLNETLGTVLLDDFAHMIPNKRAILKIDVQCAEIRILNRKTSSKFFEVNDVPLIFLEWECYRPGYNRLTVEENVLLKNMISYIYDMNYTVYSEYGKSLNYNELASYSGDNIILLKNQFEKNAASTTLQSLFKSNVK